LFVTQDGGSCVMCYRRWMRTTLAIADDVLEAAKQIARERGVSVGEVVSDLARQGLRRATPTCQRNGVPFLPAGPVVTLELINMLRDGTP
jgi:hypothetical protein